MTLWDMFLLSSYGIYHPGGLRIRVILRQNRLQTLSWSWDRGVCSRFWVWCITIGWRKFALCGRTYEFYIDGYLVIDNKVYQDWGGMGRSVASTLQRLRLPHPTPAAPTRWISYETAVDPSDPAAPTRGRTVLTDTFTFVRA